MNDHFCVMTFGGKKIHRTSNLVNKHLAQITFVTWICHVVLNMTPHWFSWKHKHETSAHVFIFLKKTEAMLVKTIYIYETRQHAKKSHILSQFLQQSMAFFGETSSQTIVNSSLGFIFSNWIDYSQR